RAVLFVHHPPTTEIYPLSLHDALPILRRVSGHADHSRGVYRLAHGIPADIPGWAGLWDEVEHWLDARHLELLQGGSHPPPLPPCAAHVQHGLRLQRKLHAAALPRRSGDRKSVV